MAQKISLKQLAVDKNNTAIFIAVGLAAFITVFSLFAANALFKQSRYQSKVITQKKVALNQLKENQKQVAQLESAYNEFASKTGNVLGGVSTGTGERDGENPRIVLDALPSKYDFPALTTSVEKMFKQFRIDEINGKDDEVAQSAQEPSVNPTAVEMPFSVTLASSSPSVKQILGTFERSIRPFQIQKVTLKTEEDAVITTVDAKTYFQPQKQFNVKSEQVR